MKEFQRSRPADVKLRIHMKWKRVFQWGALLILAGVLGACSQPHESKPEATPAIVEKMNAGGLGFRDIDHLENANVRRSLVAIARLVFPTGDLQPAQNFFRNNEHSLASFYQRLKGPQRSAFDDLLALQVGRCLELQNEQCQVRTESRQGTAVFIDQGRRLLTSFRWIVEAGTLEMPPDSQERVAIGVEMLVYSATGELIGDEKSRPLLLNVQGPAPAWAVEPSEENRFHGVAELQLAKAPPSGILLAKRPSAVNPVPAHRDEVYVVGFPMATAERKDLGSLDGLGKTLAFALGRTLNWPTALKMLGLDWEQVDPFDQTRWSLSSLAVQADATPSMLGGALINVQGDLLGILTSTTPDLANKVSFGLRITH